MSNEEKAKEYSEHRILAILADVNEDGQVFYLNEDLGTADDKHSGLSGEIEMAFENGYGSAMLQFKEYLQNKLAEIESTRVRSMDDFGQGFDYGKEQVIRNIIKEFFKED